MGIPKKYRYDISGVIGSNCPINVVTGARSYGKTYGWKKRGIKRFIETGETWGYLRTFDQEIKDILADGNEAFFSDIMRNDEFPGYKFRAMGRTMQCGKVTGKNEKTGEDVVEWRVMGQFLALTKAQSYKGKTVANMTLVVFDEFIRETKIPPYPANCVNMLLSLWETLDRREDRVRIVMLANSADAVNPYFLAWGIVPPPLGQHAKFPVGNSHVYVENCWSKEFDEYADKSNIGQFTQNSAYQLYAQKNRFANQSGAFVIERPRRTKPQMNVKWADETFCIHLMQDDLSGLYIEQKENTTVETIALTKDDARPDIYVIERNNPYLKGLVKRARIGKLYYNSDKCREQFLQVLELCGFH